MTFSKTLGAILMGLSTFSASEAMAAKITVQADGQGVAVSPMLYGIFFEEINRAGDGGLWAEMLQNVSFEDDPHAPVSWSVAGDLKASLSRQKPLNTVNPSSLQLVFGPKGGEVSNSGFSREAGKDRAAYEGGLALASGKALKLSLYQRGSAATVARLLAQDGSVLAETRIPAPKKAWTRVETALTPSRSDTKGRLVLASAGAGELWIDQVSLMPADTWKGHGMRSDLAEKVAAMKPAFVRFPGGCVVEGNKVEDAFRWKDSIGDPAGRRGVWDLWGYRTTAAFGTHEFFQWCEDLGAEPLYVINCGMGHQYAIPMEAMDERAQEALDLLEYARGPVTSTWGKRRAAAGHPAPFKLNYIEIGNENGGPDYQLRYTHMLDAIKKRYPDVHIITNVWGGVPTGRPVEIRDEHYYTNPETMQSMASHYDAYDRKEPKVYVGEYAVTQGCGTGNLIAAVSEAAFMTGLERNSDVVLMSSYAPLFVHPAWKAWNPNAIVFDHARSYGTPSYHVQAMFANNRSDATLPVTVEQSPIPYKAQAGYFGVATWGTQSEYKDIRFVASDGKVLFNGADKGMEAWEALRGTWEMHDGALRQTGTEDNNVAIIKGSHWTDGSFTMKARKLGGREGFMVMFQAESKDQHRWWNLGGWGNTTHALESVLGQPSMPGTVETGRWYDIRVELSGPRIRCYLDGKLLQDVVRSSPQQLYAVAGKAANGHEVVLKIVNVSDKAVRTTFDLKGVKSLATRAIETVLTSADPNDENSFEKPSRIVPVESTVQGMTRQFSREIPAHSVTIWRLGAEF